ncbi:glyoxalase superfamily protein [Hoeflea sp. AS16]|uniref:glyoxalase superfamily protein n=1 Tax=Hoeflea sp. AS16 TaxID=3135779 RepID=UPI00317BF5F3
MRTYLDAKAMASAMRERLAGTGLAISHSQALEIVARQFGFDTWNILAARIAASPGARDDGGIGLEAAAPIIRIFDEAKAREFYLEFLGCSVDWEHRFGPDAPLYMQVSRGAMVLHLSEHSGDATPGANAVVFARDVEKLHGELLARNYRYNRPGLQKQDWGLEMQVTDPFSNRLRFIERKAGWES